MDVLSLCPLPAARLIWQPAPSRWAVTVVSKATYRLEPGILALAEEQEPIHAHERRWEDDEKRSLYAPADLVPVKPRVDVVLVGNAYSRNAQPVRSLVARLHVGRVDKSIEVRSSLVRTPAGEAREGKAWTKMPLHYERAAGGPGTDNPVGIGPGGAPDARGERRLPNLQPPGFPIGGAQPPPPIGFGPIAADWPSRRSRAPGGPPRQDWSYSILGDGFDRAYFQAAPPDQQLDTLRPNERITLENLHPRHARLVARLPGVVVRARIEPRGGRAHEIDLVADTLWFDTRRGICAVTHRGSIDVDRPEQEGRIVVDLVHAAAEHSSLSIDKAALLRPSTAPPAPVPAPIPAVPPPPLVAPVPAPPSLLPRPSFQPAPPPPPLVVAPPSVVAPPPVVSPPPAGASFGALEASNAAVAHEAATPAEPASPADLSTRPARSPRTPAAPVIVELVWFDPEATSRLSQHPVFAEYRRSEPDPDAKHDGLDPAARLALQQRAHVYGALTRGPLSGAGALDAALDASEREPAPAIVLVSGTLDLCLDEVALLEATIAAAAPLAASDRKLQDAIDLATEMLEAKVLGPPDFLEGLTASIRDAWAKANRLLPPDHLTACTERRLLEQRSYQKRDLAGEAWIRALLGGRGREVPIPVYLPARIAKRLPLFRRFPARLLGDVIWQQDQFEAHPFALRPFALGRLPLRTGPRARRGPPAPIR